MISDIQCPDAVLPGQDEQAHPPLQHKILFGFAIALRVLAQAPPLPLLRFGSGSAFKVGEHVIPSGNGTLTFRSHCVPAFWFPGHATLRNHAPPLPS